MPGDVYLSHIRHAKAGFVLTLRYLTPKRDAMRFVSAYLVIWYIAWYIATCCGLNAEERSELARKFKYYHASVRPADRYNMIETVNGTFFGLHSEIALMAATPAKNILDLELVLAMHYSDERLIIREIVNTLVLPEEFVAWSPEIEYEPAVEESKKIYLDPKTGQLNMVIKIKASIECDSEEWTSPFSTYMCSVTIKTNPDERIFIRHTRDFRSDFEVQKVFCSIDEWPEFSLQCKMKAEWTAVVFRSYFPSFLIFVAVVFSQWKRRKVQVMLAVGGIVIVLMMQNTRPVTESLTLYDLWFVGTFLHLISVLFIDLILPTRRIVRSTYETEKPHIEAGSPLLKSTASRGTLVTAYTTTNKDAQQRLYRPTMGSRSWEEKIGYIDHPPSGRYEYEVGEENVDDEDEDHENMRTTYVHVETIPSHTISTPVTKPRNFSTLSTSYMHSSVSPLARRSNPLMTSSMSSSTKPQERRTVTTMGLGKKKKLCLLCIVSCYVTFCCAYFCLVLYALG
ncbi:unnamed protein product [Bursaphelenchus xylophilus]|uniref:(pine wood nematode) hypothetical protein n=1 Tax=Bursaphelenchus xylophilus TaxID=6326 RepID=A0A1I7RJ53_BURXY|nr:unnamed protein product [Bursaphelenchus xylophilus]CAG9119364.1 unnamed protein product [Bursaphelenchus xylophilus]